MTMAHICHAMVRMFARSGRRSGSEGDRALRKPADAIILRPLTSAPRMAFQRALSAPPSPPHARPAPCGVPVAPRAARSPERERRRQGSPSAPTLPHPAEFLRVLRPPRRVGETHASLPATTPFSGRITGPPLAGCPWYPARSGRRSTSKDNQAFRNPDASNTRRARSGACAEVVPAAQWAVTSPKPKSCAMCAAA